MTQRAIPAAAVSAASAGSRAAPARPAAPAAPVTPEQEREEILRRVLTDPDAVATELMERRRAEIQLKMNCNQAAASAEKLAGMLTEILQAKPILQHVDHVRREEDGSLRVILRAGSQFREVPLHPGVDPEELFNLKPWQYVKVHPAELIVTGVYRDDGLLGRCLGEVCSFQGYHDAAQGLVRVSREGRQTQIAMLADNLRERTLAIGDQLVLHRDNERWAIDVIPKEFAETRFEVPVESLRTRLEDVIGVESVLEPLLEDVLTRLVHDDICDTFDLKPLGGFILHSYKAGMGKTMLVRGFVNWLNELGQRRNFDVELLCVQPNELKSLWHGEDARIVREDLCGAIRARLARKRDRRLIVLVVFDEVESLGVRTGGNDGLGYASPAQNDAVQALLAEMDGIRQLDRGDGPPAQVLWVGLTNRPDMLDHALKRPGRFGDLVVGMPDYDAAAAERILWVYAREERIPWYIDGGVRAGASEEEVRGRILGPAISRVYSLPVLRYFSEGRGAVEVAAGTLMAGVHYENAMARAKRKAGVRAMRKCGIPAVTLEDVIDALIDEATSLAAQLDTDRPMLARQLQLKVPILRSETIPVGHMAEHRFVRGENGGPPRNGSPNGSPTRAEGTRPVPDLHSPPNS
jgi:SpoVK/Ycf46/Vps4 family AAA+-type ATPase